MLLIFKSKKYYNVLQLFKEICMSEVDPVSASAPISATTPASGAAPTKGVTGSAPVAEDGKISANSTFSSLSGLSQMAPEVAQALAQGIAMNIINDMKRGAKRLKNMMRTGTPDGSGPQINN
jgi:hypothetical protein